MRYEHAASYILNMPRDRNPLTGGDSSVNMVAIGTIQSQPSCRAATVTERKRPLSVFAVRVRPAEYALHVDDEFAAGRAAQNARSCVVSAAQPAGSVAWPGSEVPSMSC